MTNQELAFKLGEMHTDMRYVREAVDRIESTQEDLKIRVQSLEKTRTRVTGVFSILWASTSYFLIRIRERVFGFI